MSASKKTVTRQDVLHMAQLSRLTVGEDEIDLFCRQLSDILGYMDILEKVDTSSVEPLYSPVVHAPTMRRGRDPHDGRVDRQMPAAEIGRAHV